MLERNSNEAWQGFHYVDYDLRWDRMERPQGAAVLPLTPVGTGAAAPSCAAPHPLDAGEGR
jgi:cyclic pyranopterin phosphate synthase